MFVVKVEIDCFQEETDFKQRVPMKDSDAVRFSNSTDGAEKGMDRLTSV